MPSPFTYSRLVQFSETDLAGLALFANFFRWMEEAEHAYSRSVGLSVRTEYQEMEIGWPRVSTSCDFLAPARFEDELQIAVRIAKMGEKSISWEMEFSRDGTRLAVGKATTVCCIWNNEGLKPIPIPAEVRLKLNPP